MKWIISMDNVLYIDHMDKETLVDIDPELKALKKRTREALKKDWRCPRPLHVITYPFHCHPDR